MDQETHHLVLAFTWVHLHTHNYTPPTCKVHTYTLMKVFKDTESDWLLMNAVLSFWSEYMSTTSHLLIFLLDVFSVNTQNINYRYILSHCCAVSLHCILFESDKKIHLQTIFISSPLMLSSPPFLKCTVWYHYT